MDDENLIEAEGVEALCDDGDGDGDGEVVIAMLGVGIAAEWLVGVVENVDILIEDAEEG